MRVLSWAIGLVIALAIVLFAVSNRQVVTLGFWPLPGTISLPLFIPMLGLAFLAFLAGGLIAWMSSGSWRRLARRRGRQADELEQRLRVAQERLEANRTPRPAAVPMVRVTSAAETIPIVQSAQGSRVA